MVALPLILGWAVLASELVPRAPEGYRPSGSAVDLLDLGRLALLRDPSLRTRFVAHEPSAGGRPDDGDAVLAETRGPGILQGLWIGDDVRSRRSEDRDPGRGLLRIYLDGAPQPALEATLAELASGRHPRVPGPLVGTLGGLTLRTPVPFHRGLKVVLRGGARRPARAQVLALRDPSGLETFEAVPSEREKAALARVAAAWAAPGDAGPAGGIDGEEPAEFQIDAEARSTHVYLLPAGPRTVRSFELVPSADTAEAWRAARLRLIWDGDDPERPGVDLTLGAFFGRPVAAAPYRSLLAGCSATAWANRMPMPYRRQALLQIDSERPITGTLRIRSRAGRDADAGYLRAGVGPLRAQGRGHLVGTVRVAPRDRSVEGWAGHFDFFPAEGESTRHIRVSSAYSYAQLMRAAPEPGRPAFDPVVGLAEEPRGASSALVVAFDWRVADPILFAASTEEGAGPPPSGPEAAPGTAAFWYAERPATLLPGE